MPTWGVSPIARADELMIRNRRNTSGMLAVLVWGASALNAPAGGFRLASEDAFATARGEAFVATADNASAVYYNPAGLTQLEGFNFRGGVYGISYDPTYTPRPPRDTNTFHSKKQVAAAPQFFMAFTPKDSPVSLGLGVYAPYGGDIAWPQNTGFRTIATEGSLTYATINQVVAVKLAPGLSIAGGLMMNYADLEMTQGLLANERPLTNYFRFKGTGWTPGYNVGLRWQPHQRVSLGATFRSTAPFTLNGNTEFEQQYVSGLYPPTNRVAHADFQFPLTTVFGISYRPTPKWNLEFNADYTDWSSFGTATLYQKNPPAALKEQTPITLKWQSSWMYEFGVTRYFDNGWHLSAGYVYSENSVPDAHYTPLAADLDRHFFSVGAGYKGKRFEFDLAYQIGYGPDRNVTGSAPPSIPGKYANQTADGTYDFFSAAVLLTVGAHF